ncbi:ubiquinone/menaquinone biosynthesis C-methylase UbiE [Algoriphagus boseongensis]|uniref:Ubiquinone/menaquinone biosynthesis C-methylase UbiE n=1 Tax=Algoriphagus boseongensis TaxID=1442587 RepID=A0A4R6T466_9BACT|nr:class I SAM-dependent methyltransferase [Algoriphagus boseongensis]TDQ17053.1 ubiquinone/menaquinone biosynthesis C-methylase UbiE [Algoriphagus boseongensis]
MNLTFGQAQCYTSERMNSHVALAKIFRALFGYTNVGNYARFTIFQKLVKQIPLSEKAQILDLGTGYGEYAISLAEALPAAKIHALDIDKSRIQTLNHALNQAKISNVETYDTYLQETEIQELDFAFSVDVFEHIAPEQMPFAEVLKRLKPGGYFLVKIPNKTQKTIFPEKYFEEHQEWLEDEHIGQVYDLKGLQARFKQEGFEVVHASNSDGYLSRFAWEIAYLGKKAGVLTQLLSLPLAKGLIHMDRWVHSGKWGNAIQVIGRKPL